MNEEENKPAITTLEDLTTEEDKKNRIVRVDVTCKLTHPIIDFAIMFDPPPAEVIKYAKEWPKKWIFIFQDKNPLSTLYYRELWGNPACDHVMEPYYIGNLTELHKSKVIKHVVGETILQMTPTYQKYLEERHARRRG